MKYTKQKIFTNTLIFYILLQPILELMWLNNGQVGEILGVTLPTLIRILGIAIIGLEWIYINRFSKKTVIFILYCFITMIYFVLHHLNCVKFNSAIGGGLGYNVVQESFYLIRMLIPLSIILFMLSIENSKEIIKKITIGLSIMISLLVIVPNILRISFGSYTDKIVTLNILDWFFKPEQCTYLYTASKGFFYWSIISAVLIVIFPYIINLFLKTGKYRYLFLIIVQGIAMFTFGTKAASLSVIICMSIMLLCYLVLNIIQRKYDWKVVQFILGGVTVCIFLGIYSKSPCQQRMTFEEQFYEERNDEEEIIEEKLESKKKLEHMEEIEEIVKYFDENKETMSITLDFLEGNYGYKEDPLFWKEFVVNTIPSERLKNRFVEEEMLKRIIQRNENSGDKLWGIGYSRTTNVYNLERDFLYQYYSMGIFGVVLLLGPYIVLLIFGIIKMLLHIKQCTLEQCALGLGLGLTFCVAYFSGNMMESLGISIVIGCMEGYFLTRTLLLGDKCESIT